MDSLEREALEKRKKMIALGCLPLSVGFFVWRLQGSTSAAPPPPPPPPSVVAKAAPQVAAAAGPVLSLEKKKVVAVPVSGKDPFMPAFALTTVQSPAEAETPKPAFTEPPVRLAGLPSLPMPDLKPFGPPPAPAVNAPRPIIPDKPAAPVMPYILTGIVKGSPDVAILRHADGSRRIARVGDMLDEKFRLAAIKETTVRIEGAGMKKTLELGQAGFNPPAPDAPVADKNADLLSGTPDPKTETTLGEGNDTHDS